MLNLPTEFVDKYRTLLGKTKANKLFDALDNDPKKAYRINSLNKQYKFNNHQASSVPDIPQAYYGQFNSQSPEWVSGIIYSQDPAAMFPALITNAKPGQRILDLCAAPGGKSTALGEQLRGKGLLVANEISASRAKILRENIERWGITNALVTNESPQKLAPQFPAFFDKIIVDAPCSGEGMFRKNKDAITYWSQDYIQLCQNRQKEILTEAVKMLAPGGELIYSTCTFAPEEDEQIVSWLVKQYNFKISPINLKEANVDHGQPKWGNGNSSLRNTLRFWPFDNLGEGQFIAKLQSSIHENSINKHKKKHSNRDATNRLTQEEKLWISKVMEPFKLPTSLINWSKTSRVSNGHVFIPAIEDKLSLKILNNGVELGIIKKNRFEPGHQLAMVLGQIHQDCVINLSENDYIKFLHGEALPTISELRGFVLVSYREGIFSFGKITGNAVLKNFYPKGLRTKQ
ncbi:MULTISPECIES: RsmB/NOP family class I SAM-dependent RNA methyltransferase [unclassified Lactobacillus]|uniref:RsmB/NOP family class I SAM-dependent RNA methyltransferase n=1 Tax=unclassified Lactobacillus TaxID=2620435 RepID=UPI000EFD92C6|nr:MULTISPECIES: RsmB/NOP family class I SAM-dependent RNA methyltransferase [unclassified Lactobacillus]RMC24649.1 RNA methyltransferase [Lactobacillus sp. ESL0247]RMC28921.1 RNA methyltransferase [Lactobacillus sp. ESL0246]RMC32166.1 RNA methyltransferase [Lactobacillus sp. ESL0245]